MGTLNLLLYVRHPVDWINSFFNQVIKAHRVTITDIDTFSIENDRLANFLDIETHVARWRTHGGDPTITVRPYTHRTDVIGTFLDWIGAEKRGLSPRSVASDFSVDPNPAADETSLRVLLDVKRRMKDRPLEDLAAAMTRAHQALRDRWTGTPGLANLGFLSETERRMVEQRYAAQYDGLLKRFGQAGYKDLETGKPFRYVARESLREVLPHEKALASEIVAGL
ncbi:hypothetical protein D1F64_02165 [Breoghania sp. L-A4]|nr:hypothetical protein D1F64_02165 [Breoghania sp. L-A4]